MGSFFFFFLFFFLCTLPGIAEERTVLPQLWPPTTTGPGVRKNGVRVTMFRRAAAVCFSIMFLAVRISARTDSA